MPRSRASPRTSKTKFPPHALEPLLPRLQGCCWFFRNDERRQTVEPDEPGSEKQRSSFLHESGSENSARRLFMNPNRKSIAYRFCMSRIGKAAHIVFAFEVANAEAAEGAPLLHRSATAQETASLPNQKSRRKGEFSFGITLMNAIFPIFIAKIITNFITPDHKPKICIMLNQIMHKCSILAECASPARFLGFDSSHWHSAHLAGFRYIFWQAEALLSATKYTVLVFFPRGKSRMKLSAANSDAFGLLTASSFFHAPTSNTKSVHFAAVGGDFACQTLRAGVAGVAGVAGIAPAGGGGRGRRQGAAACTKSHLSHIKKPAATVGGVFDARIRCRFSLLPLDAYLALRPLDADFTLPQLNAAFALHPHTPPRRG